VRQSKPVSTPLSTVRFSNPNADLDEKQRNVSHANADGSRYIKGKLDAYPPALQAKGIAAYNARSEMFRNALK